jgi:long-subunit acyl-CoA synthetase (AMP-forming)
MRSAGFSRLISKCDELVSIVVISFSLCRYTKVYSWDAFMKLGADVPDATLAARIADQKPGHCCTLVYTSGTTGNPKVGLK